MIVFYCALQLGGTIIPSIFGFLMVAMLTRYLSPFEYGIFGLATAIAQLISQACFGWIGLSAMRMAAGAPAEVFRANVLAIFAALSAAAIGSAVLYHLAADSTQSAIWLAGIVGAVALAYVGTKGSLFSAAIDFRRSFGFNIARAAASFALALAAVKLGAGGLAVFLWSSAGVVVASPFFRLSQRANPIGKLDLSEIRRVLQFGLPLAASLVLFAIAAWADRLVVEAFAGLAAVGVYTAATVLVQNTLAACVSAVGSVSLALAVKAFEKSKEECDRQLKQNVLLLLGCLLPAGLGLALTAPNVATVFVGPSYRATVVELMPWLAGSAVIFGVRGGYVDLAFHLSKRTRRFLSLATVTVVSNIAGLLVLVPALGYRGAAITALLTAVVSFIYATVAASRCFPLPIPGREIGKIFMAVAVMAVILQPLLPLRGPVALLLQIGCGAATYLGALFALNVANIRGVVAEIVVQRLGAPYGTPRN